MCRPFLLLLILLSCIACIQAAPLAKTSEKCTPSCTLDSLVFTPKIQALGAGVSKQSETTVAPTLLAHASFALETRHQKWSLRTALDLIAGRNTFYARSAQAGYNRRFGQGKSASRWRGRWNWKPLPSATVTLGKDTLHDGWGRRSLFHGRQAAPVAFAQIKLNSGGRVRYRHRIEALQGAFQMNCVPEAHGNPQTWLPQTGRLRTGVERWVVSHRLEVDFGKRLTGALWGAVVWNANQRNFEPHYLIPLTSLRPTEYAQGSSDNALVGVEGRLRLGSNPQHLRALYGQFVLDELIVSELLGGTEWWGNKFGLLGGLEWGTFWGGWRIEFSAARPWTYSHYTSSAAYVHGLTPLAHPLGANFAELALEGNWASQVWSVHLRATGSVRGDQEDGHSPTGSMPHVGDIERTEETYAWLNGSKRQRVAIALDLARSMTIGKKTPVHVFVQGLYGYEMPTFMASAPAQEWWVGFGIRTTGPFLGSDW